MKKARITLTIEEIDRLESYLETAKSTHVLDVVVIKKVKAAKARLLKKIAKENN